MQGYLKKKSGPHGARPVHLITKMIKWIRTSRLSIKNSLSLTADGAGHVGAVGRSGHGRQTAGQDLEKNDYLAQM